MSFSQSVAPMARLNAGTRLLQGSTLGMMSQYLLTVLAAALLAAVYQLAQEETKQMIEAIRARARYRSSRNDALLLEALGSDLLPDLQDRLLRAHDTFRAAMRILTDPLVEMTDKRILRELMRKVHSGRPDDHDV